MARLKLAGLEAERDREPFEVELRDGTVVELMHPKQLPADVLLDYESMTSRDRLEALLGDADTEAFLRAVDGDDMDEIWKAYNEHFGIGSPGEGNASPPSSNGTARRSKPTSRSGGSR